MATSSYTSIACAQRKKQDKVGALFHSAPLSVRPRQLIAAVEREMIVQTRPACSAQQDLRCEIRLFSGLQSFRYIWGQTVLKETTRDQRNTKGKPSNFQVQRPTILWTYVHDAKAKMKLRLVQYSTNCGHPERQLKMTEKSSGQLSSSSRKPVGTRTYSGMPSRRHRLSPAYVAEISEAVMLTTTEAKRICSASSSLDELAASFSPSFRASTSNRDALAAGFVRFRTFADDG